MMMERPTIPTDEHVQKWLAELGSQLCDDPGSTITEMVDATGRTKNSILRLVRKGLAEGRYKRGWARREDTSGRMQRVPVYTVVAEEEK